ncbi:MAG: TrkH family potassium uptake protein [Candidatus Micrarchaeota archaeon]
MKNANSVLWFHLKQIMFAAGFSLLLPAAYAYYAKQDVLRYMLVTSAVLMLPGLPYALKSATHTVWDAVKRLFHAPASVASWNYALKILTPTYLTHLEEKEITRSQAIVLAALSWVIIPLIASIPYFYAGLNAQDAVFESMSGWTATGLTVIQNVEALPSSLLFYRSFTQWVGGVGILLFALFVLRAPAAGKLLQAEGRSLTEPNARKTAKIIWGIYVSITLVGVCLAFLSGLQLLKAVNLTMTAVATGGFITTNSLTLTFLQKIVFVLLMLAGATSFTLYYRAFKENWRSVFKHSEFKAMLGLVVLVGTLIVVSQKTVPENAVFQATSALTGTGLAVEKIEYWSEFAKYLLILLMVSGGCSGSTTGALKLWRVIVLSKTLWMRIKSVFLPERAIQVIKVNNHPLTSDEAIESGNFVFIYLFALVIATGAVMVLGFSAINSAFAVASALGNVGLTTIPDLYAFPALGKLVLVCCMWLGRIEILPSIVFFAFILKKT